MRERVRIQVGNVDDTEGLRKVQRETWLSTYPNEAHGITKEDIEALEETEKDWMERSKKRFADPASHTWIVKDGEEIVGFSIARKEENNGLIQAMYILPSYQSKKIGEGLMKEALSWLGDQDVYVNVVSYNTRAIKFYERCGFVKTEREVPEEDLTVLPSGAKLPEIQMFKKAPKAA